MGLADRRGATARDDRRGPPLVPPVSPGLGGPAYDAAIDGADEASHDRWRGRFTRALPDYPLLARIHDLYADAAFAASELPALRAECERARALGQEALPVSHERALRKLLYAVGQAERTSARTLVLECD